MHWYLEVLRKYALFNGRSRRSEYWYFFLFNLLVTVGLGFIDNILRRTTGLEIGLLGTTYSLAIMLPAIGVSIRRLHDTDRSGWWLLLAMVPLVGILVFVFMAEDSNAGTNRYGQNPKLAIA